MVAKKPEPKRITLEHEIKAETQLSDHRRKLNRAARKTVASKDGTAVLSDAWEDELLTIAAAHLEPPDRALQDIQQAFDQLREKEGKSPSQRKVAERSNWSREVVRDRWPRLKR